MRVHFDGKAIDGFAGDTLASALLANGVRLVGRSFKYHRPRGILTAGPEEPNALVELRSGARREPNTRATTIELFDGLEAASQNRWPSLRFDLLAVNSLLAPFFPAGFYYKTFMWPAAFWEKRLRAASSAAPPAWAAPPRSPIPTATSRRTPSATCWSSAPAPPDLAAALAAARAGARVILCEEDFAPAAACWPTIARSAACPAARGPRRSSPNCAACPTCG